MKIEFNERESEALLSFVDRCEKANKMSEDGVHEKLTYEYVVSQNNGLGCSVKVRCKELKLIEDITDYGSW